jgi:hypothetical protein
MHVPRSSSTPCYHICTTVDKWSLTRCESWVQHIYINADIDLSSGYPFLQLVNDSQYSNSIDIFSLHYCETTSKIIPQVTFGTQYWSSNACVDRSIANQAFLVGDVQKCAMVYSTMCNDSAKLKYGALHPGLTHSVRYLLLVGISDLA